MANTPHRLDTLLEDFYELRQIAVKAALLPDPEAGHINTIERMMLDLIDRLRDLLGDYRLDQLAGQSLERNGHTERTFRLMRDACLNVSPFERQPANVIPFRPRPHGETA